jgi:hypothetical protein
MEIWILYLIIVLQAILFILYFTGMWDVVIFVQILCRVFGHVLESVISCLLPAKRKSLRGELALVTGAASGIGRLTALNLAKEGKYIEKEVFQSCLKEFILNEIPNIL